MAITKITQQIFNTKIFPNSTTQQYQVVDMDPPNTFINNGGWVLSQTSITPDAPASPAVVPVVVDPASGISYVSGVPTSKPFGIPILVGIVGQSNELGQGATSEAAAYPQAFASIKKPSFCSPIYGAVGKKGSWWHKTYDDLSDLGVDVTFVQSARGNASFIKHWVGAVATRSNSTGYAQTRSPQGGGDTGCFGELIVMGGKLFQCTTGNQRYATYYGNGRIPGTTVSRLDFVSDYGGLTTAASDPGGWSSATLGSTIVDGGITWTCIDATNSVGFYSGKVLDTSASGIGFDPLGLLYDLHQKCQSIQGVSDKFIAVSNGQADMGAAQADYQAALTAIASYYTARGYKVMLGLTCYNPSGSNISMYNTLTTARNAAAAALYSSGVYDGPNLYQLMGTTGPMAAGGAYMQADNVHINCAGLIAAGRYWSLSIVSMLRSLKYAI